MTCPDCANAEARLWHGFASGCAGCAARMVSRSYHYHAAQAQGRQTKEYRALLEAMGVTHEQVREAAAKDHIRPGAPST